MFTKQARTTKSNQTVFVGVVATLSADIGVAATPMSAGSTYALVPQERQRQLFKLLGMNVARRLKNKQSEWQLYQSVQPVQ